MENVLTQWNFIAGKSTSELRFVYGQQILDELTSRSIVVRTDFPDFDMLDAMIRAALKKLLKTQSNFWNRVSVEEQRAQKHHRFLRGRHIAYMIYEYLLATNADEAVQGLSTLLAFSLQNDDVKISTSNGIMLYYL